MDESVIFVGEVRNGSSTEQQKMSTRSQTKLKKSNSQRVVTVDLTRDSEELKPSKGVEQKLSASTNSKFPCNLIQDKNSASIDCPICLEPLQDLEVRVTQCGHMFCKNCMDVLISNKVKPKCPKCRKIIDKAHIIPLYF